MHQNEISQKELLNALRVKEQERNTLSGIDHYAAHLTNIEASPEMQRMWKQHAGRYPYAKGIELESIIAQIRKVFEN